MSTAPLEAAAASSRNVLAAMSADDLDKTTPCKSWDVRGLVNHMIGTVGFMGSAVSGNPPAGGDATDGDVLAAYDKVAADAIAAFGADGALDKTYDLPFGSMPGSAVLGMLSTDLFVHGWDLARALGQSTDLDPALAGQLLEQSRASIQPAFRGDEPMPFGPEQSAAADATNADKLAAFLGREQ